MLFVIFFILIIEQGFLILRVIFFIGTGSSKPKEPNSSFLGFFMGRAMEYPRPARL